MTKIVVLDAGHGGSDSGAIGNGIKEKDIVLEIAKKTKAILDATYSDVNVILTRSTDKFVELTNRSKIANQAKAHLFVSIHINAATSKVAHGFETFIYNKTNSATTKSYQKKLHDVILKSAPYFTNRGYQSANFSVLRNTLMPAILTESGFISNVNDSSVLKTKAKLDAIAQGHAYGIASCLGLTKKPVAPTSTTIYKVQVGSYDDKAQAESIRVSIEKLGYKNVSVISEKA